MADHYPAANLGERLLTALSGSRLAWLVLLGLAGADILLTTVGIRTGLREQNPVAAWALSNFGTAGLVGLKTFALGVLAVVVERLPERYGQAAFGGFGATQLCAVGWNGLLVASQL